MKILTILLHPGYTKNFVSVFNSLAERGHTIHIGFIDLKDSKDWINKGVENIFSGLGSKNIVIDRAPVPTGKHGLTAFLDKLRLLYDATRFYHKIYDKSPKLKRRFLRKVPSAVRFYLNYFSRTRINSLFRRGLIKIDGLANTPKQIDDYIRKVSPDLLIVSPLVDGASKQTDYIKSSRKLMIPNMLWVFSWDNLTNKGSMIVKPDNIIVWNQIQQKEAINFHGVKGSNVHISGAPCFDKWFGRNTAYSREEFYKLTNLDINHPYILYLCSSKFIAEKEVEFVMKLIRHMRNSNHGKMRKLGVLIRPHPQYSSQWEDVNFKGLNNISIFPRSGEIPIDYNSESNYYDSLYHSLCVVGVNTSALIEAGILKKTVFTITDGVFKDTQYGTIHFRYLVEGKLLNIADNINDFMDKLNSFIDNPPHSNHQASSFIERFVRPNAIDLPATGIMVDKIEKIHRKVMKHGKELRISPKRPGPVLIIFSIIFGGFWMLSQLTDGVFDKFQIIIRRYKFKIRKRIMYHWNKLFNKAY